MRKNKALLLEKKITYIYEYIYIMQIDKVYSNIILLLKDRCYRYSQLFLEKEIKRAYVPISELKI